MFIDDVKVLNADSSSSAWWDKLAQTPDEPGTICAVLTMRLSHREYQELLLKDNQARTATKDRMNLLQQQEALQREVAELTEKLDKARHTSRTFEAALDEAQKKLQLLR